MELIKSLIDFVLHIDVHLVEIVNNYQAWTYLILFFIIFAETGLVVTPFLPGDSLLFAAGAIVSKYRGKTIIYARFIPIIRTFAPFVAGIGMMSYGRFMIYNIAGSVAWVTSFLFLGYYFGGLPVIKENFTYVIFVIIFVSLLPALIGVIRQNMKPKVAEVDKPME